MKSRSKQQLTRLVALLGLLLPTMAIAGRELDFRYSYDRTDSGQKLHAQSFGAIEHFDFKQAGGYSYEQAFQSIRKLGLGMDDIEEQFRRMAFNVIARNQDDHVKNIAFLMKKSGVWSLSPAYDMTYSYNPKGDWTGTHQMSLNGKRDGFDIEDFKACANTISMKRGRTEDILEEVQSAVLRWPEIADQSNVGEDNIRKITNAHRLKILKV